MNRFIAQIASGKLASLAQLKSCYRREIKKIHPDIAGKGSTEFLAVQAQYMEAKDFLEKSCSRSAKSSRSAGADADGERYSMSQVRDLFVDLMCSNFPLDRRVAHTNKLYDRRIASMNAMVNSLLADTDLFLKFEKDMYALRGDSVVSNHEYNVVVSYLNNIRDFILAKTVRGRSYIRNTYPLIASILAGRNLDAGMAFINWMVQDIIGKEYIKGEIPAARRGE